MGGLNGDHEETVAGTFGSKASWLGFTQVVGRPV